MARVVTCDYENDHEHALRRRRDGGLQDADISTNSQRPPTSARSFILAREHLEGV